MKWKCWRAGGLAAALVAVPALAQDAYYADERGFDETGVTVRGGVTTYTGDLGGETDPGGFLGIQADGSLIGGVGFELGYEGAANGFEGNDNGTLWRHNVGGLAKVGPVLNETWRPFVGAGVGVSYLDPTGDAAALGFDEDFVFEVPLAAGAEYRLGGLTAGVRATYRIVTGEDLAAGNVDEGDLFTAGLSLGGRF